MGVMEGSVRNLSRKKCSAACTERFQTNGSTYRAVVEEADGLQVDWGRHIDPEDLRKHLSENTIS